MTQRLIIVDYGMGNLQSVQNALSYLGQESEISSSAQNLDNAFAYILPGVGAFPKAMKNLEESGLIKALTENVIKKKKPILGICLGMQLIATHSEELGGYKGLNWIEAEVKLIKPGDGSRVPHVGWNNLKIENTVPMFKNIENDSNFYFDHSYHMICEKKNVIATCDYGGEIVAAIQSDNIYAAQFHPEKSQTVGLKFLRNFLNVVQVC